MAQRLGAESAQLVLICLGVPYASVLSVPVLLSTCFSQLVGAGLAILVLGTEGPGRSMCQLSGPPVALPSFTGVQQCH